MPKLPIRIYDDPVLREKARPIAAVENRHRELARDMIDTMYAARGIGLAANQVGSLERIIIVDVDWADREEDGISPVRQPEVLINPEVLEESADDDESSEGCLSLPGIDGDVWRSLHIRYRYTDLEGRVHEAEAEDLKARCILHEVDHLDGILFIDRMIEENRRKLAGRLALLRKSREQGATGTD